MEHDTNLRDLASMFALAGLIIRNREDDNLAEVAHKLAETAHDIADQWMKARDKEPEEGLAAIKKEKRNVRKHEDIR
jgi:hypothetical protein